MRQDLCRVHWLISESWMAELCACLAIAAGYVVPFSLPPARGLRNDAKTVVFRMALCSMACSWSWLPLLARVQARLARSDPDCACALRANLPPNARRPLSVCWLGPHRRARP